MKAPDFRIDTTLRDKQGPETIPAFWNPGLFGIKFAPDDFMRRLAEVDPLLKVVWNAHLERWQVFCPSFRAVHPLCRGWRLLFIVHDGSGGYVPLDERTIAKIWSISGMTQGSGKQYFDRVVGEMEREKAQAEKSHDDEVSYKAGEYFDYCAKPKVGYGPISASKVVGQ